MKKKKKEWIELLTYLYPRKREKTKNKIYARLKSRIYNWKSKYHIDSDDVNLCVYNIIGANTKCIYCGELMTPDNISLDHVVPINRGGGFDDVNNMQFICKRCNVRKGQLTHKEYTALINLIDTFDEQARKYIFRKLSSKDFG